MNQASMMTGSDQFVKLIDSIVMIMVSYGHA